MKKILVICSGLIALAVCGYFGYNYYLNQKNPYNTYAEKSQQTLSKDYYSDEEAQYINNMYPVVSGPESQVFNYWWIAHFVDVKIDGYERSGKESYLEEAKEAYRYNKERNGTTLLNDLNDDMLWNALAALRLYTITDDPTYLKDAKFVYDNLIETSWNDEMGGGFSWKKSQADYKNTPVNAPFIILALRLYEIEESPEYLEWSEKTLDWMTETLVDPDTEIVWDGINREGNGQIDKNWLFTYNQGVYIGALVEFYNVTKDEDYLIKAVENAKTTLETLPQDGIFLENSADGGGDLGLFKGIFYRYAALLYKATDEEFIKDFMNESCDIMVEHSLDGDDLLISRDWLNQTDYPYIYLSDQIGGVMALEATASIN